MKKKTVFKKIIICVCLVATLVSSMLVPSFAMTEKELIEKRTDALNYDGSFNYMLLWRELDLVPVANGILQTNCAFQLVTDFMKNSCIKVHVSFDEAFLTKKFSGGVQYWTFGPFDLDNASHIQQDRIGDMYVQSYHSTTVNTIRYPDYFDEYLNLSKQYFLCDFTCTNLAADGSTVYVLFEIIPDVTLAEGLSKVVYDRNSQSGAADTIAQLEAQITALQSQIEDCDSMIAILNGQISGLMSELETKNNQISTLQGDKSTLQSQKDSLQKELNTAKSNLSSVQAQKEYLQTQYDMLQAEYDARELEHEEEMKNNHALRNLFNGIGQGLTTLLNAVTGLGVGGITIGGCITVAVVIFVVYIIIRLVLR